MQDTGPKGLQFDTCVLDNEQNYILVWNFFIFFMHFALWHMFQLKSCCKSFGVIQGGHLKAGGVLKTHTYTYGRRALGTGKLVVITREQQETRGVLVAGRAAWRLKIKEGILIKQRVKEKKCQL